MSASLENFFGGIKKFAQTISVYMGNHLMRIDLVRDACCDFKLSQLLQSISGNAIDIPCLLFNSACPSHQHGLANSSGFAECLPR
jgi:hypothetical protein